MIYVTAVFIIAVAVAMYVHLLKTIKKDHRYEIGMLDRIYNKLSNEIIEQSNFRAAQNALREQYYKRKKKPMWAGPVQAAETTTPETERTDV
jgi:hypothetical protein